MIHDISMSALVAASLCGCGVSFDMVPEDASRLHLDRVRTTDGEVEEVPDELEGEVHFRELGDAHLMAPDAVGTPVRAVVVPASQIRRARRAGWRTLEPTFSHRFGDVAIWGGDLVVRDGDGGAVIMALPLVDHIEITDVRLRREQAIMIVIGGVALAAAGIGAFAYGVSQLDFY
jgi:hypothetical protein